MPHDEPVAVIGCGQTGAECVVELRRRGFTDIRWLGSRSWFAPMDDSPTANEMFRPAYSEFLDSLPMERRRELAKEHVLTSDGISASTLRTVFQDNYEEMLRSGRAPVTVLPGRRVVAGRPRGRGIVLSCQRAHGPEQQEVRFAVVAAGRRPAPLPFGPQLREMIDTDDLGQPDGGDRLFAALEARRPSQDLRAEPVQVLPRTAGFQPQPDRRPQRHHHQFAFRAARVRHI